MLHEKTTFAIFEGREKREKHDSINLALERNAGASFFFTPRFHLALCANDVGHVFIVLCCFVNNIMICTQFRPLIWISSECKGENGIETEPRPRASTETDCSFRVEKCINLSGICFPYSFYCYLLCVSVLLITSRFCFTVLSIHTQNNFGWAINVEFPPYRSSG